MILRRVALLACLLVAIGLALAPYFTCRNWEQGSREDARPADAIVVLGAAQYNGRPSPLFQARLDHAVELYKRGIAPWLILTGGMTAGDRVTEAAAGRADAQVTQQVRRLTAELFPDGQLAERLYPVLPYVLRLGRETVVGALRRDLRWDEPGLQEIAL